VCRVETLRKLKMPEESNGLDSRTPFLSANHDRAAPMRAVHLASEGITRSAAPSSPAS